MPAPYQCDCGTPVSRQQRALVYQRSKSVNDTRPFGTQQDVYGVDYEWINHSLAPAYIEVGELDIFRDESVAYASALMRAGVSCELHVYPGAPHGYDLLNLEASLSRRAFADRVRLIAVL